jgi:hypothetical protein
MAERTDDEEERRFRRLCVAVLLTLAFEIAVFWVITGVYA